MPRLRSGVGVKGTCTSICLSLCARDGSGPHSDPKSRGARRPQAKPCLDVPFIVPIAGAQAPPEVSRRTSKACEVCLKGLQGLPGVLGGCCGLPLVAVRDGQWAGP